MQIHRSLTDKIQKNLGGGRVLILFGPRQAGKTTLIKQVFDHLPPQKTAKFFTGDDIHHQQLLSGQSITELKKIAGGLNYLFIDEAQRIKNIGLNLKLLVDHFPALKILATGSASFDLGNKTAEALTGRKLTLFLYPLSFWELSQHFGAWDTKQNLNDLLIWGSYPKTIQLTSQDSKETYLAELTGSYLYKDILELEGIKKSRKIVDLLRLLAFQVGSLVSVNELSSSLNMDARTVNRYLDLLEKSFVVFSLSGFSRNLRKEIGKNSKYYFFDNGVRNTLINNFNPPALRNDTGQLWENFLMTERIKHLHYQNQLINRYFWRTYDQKELDLIEESGGQLNGFEFKWGDKGKIKNSTQKLFTTTYPNSKLKLINQTNYPNFLTTL